MLSPPGQDHWRVRRDHFSATSLMDGARGSVRLRDGAAPSWAAMTVLALAAMMTTAPAD